jgi:CobQ-like glutamine amidotransferase family enzyme
MKPDFYITHLYPEQMNIYGDWGNILALSYRLENYGFGVVYQPVGLDEKLPNKTDLYFIGGGQDKEQILIFNDLIRKKEKLIDDVEDGVCLLSICGGYQLLGQSFLTGEGQAVEGIGIFDVQTKAPDTSVSSRCIGNLVVKSLVLGLEDITLIGFENHSGQTDFVSTDKSKPLGQTLIGFGNNLEAKFEGCYYKNAFGTYMHGSFLPKNPEFTDHLIFQAVRRKAEKSEIHPQVYLDSIKNQIDDSIAIEAKQSLIARLKSELKK